MFKSIVLLSITPCIAFAVSVDNQPWQYRNENAAELCLSDQSLAEMQLITQSIHSITQAVHSLDVFENQTQDNVVSELSESVAELTRAIENLQPE